MSSHPYRQKAASTNAPYPVEDYGEPSPPREVGNNHSGHESSGSLGQAPGSGYQTPVQEMDIPAPLGVLGGASNEADGAAGTKAPYPVYGSLTPPPVFTQKEPPLMSPKLESIVHHFVCDVPQSQPKCIG